jgi:hypothetical protein
MENPLVDQACVQRGGDDESRLAHCDLTGSSAAVCSTHVLVSRPIDAAATAWNVRVLGFAA